MSFGSFFKNNKNQRFEYRPLYYDPNKEDLEKRLKGKSQLSFKRSSLASSRGKSVWIRWAALAGLLYLIFYYVFQV